MTRSFKLWGIEFTLVDILLRVLLPIALLFLVYKGLLFLVKKIILKPLRIQEETKTRIFRYVRLFLRIALLVGVLIVFIGFLGPDILEFLGAFWKVLTTPVITAGSTQITIITILLTIPVFYLASWLSRITKRFVDSSLLTKLTFPEDTKFTISILLRNLVLIVAALFGLSIIGIDLSSLAILFGVLGVGLGFGLQGTVANFMAGLILIFERPIKEGDRIRVSGMEGNVVQIRFRSTIINTITNETIVVPNKNLVEDNIHNYSYGNERIIVVNSTQVSYGSDLEKVRDVLLTVNDDNPYALKKPSPEARIMEFQDSGILVELRTWIGRATDKYQAIAWINMQIWKKFKEAGVQIPFPQMDLHVKELPVAGADQGA